MWIETEKRVKTEMKRKVGDKVRVKSLDWYNKNKHDGHLGFFTESMSQYCGKVLTITTANSYIGDPDTYVYLLEGKHWNWLDYMFEDGIIDEYSMDIITGATGSGKTVAMLKHCAANNLTIVTKDSRTCSLLIEDARSLGLNIQAPINFSQYTKNVSVSTQPNQGFFIDDIKQFQLFVFQKCRGFVCDAEDVILLEIQEEVI